MNKLLLTLSLSLVVMAVHADEMGPTKGTDLPPARTTAPKPVAAPVEAAPAAATPAPVVAPVEVAPAAPAAPVVATPVARAAGTGWYAGVGGGWSSFNGNGVDIASTIPGEVISVTRLDDSSTGWKVFGGYQFNKNWAAELAYTDLGKFSMDGDVISGGIGGYTGPEYGEVKPACWSLSAVGILPVGNNFSLLGKAGVCRWDDRYKGDESGNPEMSTSTGTDLTFGLGAKYDATKNLGVRAEWERFDNVVHDRNSVDLWSMSLQYSF